jgi:hypothetical protein
VSVTTALVLVVGILGVTLSMVVGVAARSAVRIAEIRRGQDPARRT